MDTQGGIILTRPFLALVGQWSKLAHSERNKLKRKRKETVPLNKPVQTCKVVRSDRADLCQRQIKALVTIKFVPAFLTTEDVT